MTEIQQASLAEFLRPLKVARFHSGDCIGSDEQAFRLVRKLHPNAWMVVHPPKNKKHRAYCKPWSGCGEIRKEQEYLKRNHDIVDAVDILIITPGEQSEIRVSGTWSTCRYARKTNKPVVIVFPDGSLILEKNENHRQL